MQSSSVKSKKQLETRNSRFIIKIAPTLGDRTWYRKRAKASFLSWTRQMSWESPTHMFLTHLPTPTSPSWEKLRMSWVTRTWSFFPSWTKVMPILALSRQLRRETPCHKPRVSKCLRKSRKTRIWLSQSTRKGARPLQIKKSRKKEISKGNHWTSCSKLTKKNLIKISKLGKNQSRHSQMAGQVKGASITLQASRNKNQLLKARASPHLKGALNLMPWYQTTKRTGQAWVPTSSPLARRSELKRCQLGEDCLWSKFLLPNISNDRTFPKLQWSTLKFSIRQIKQRKAYFSKRASREGTHSRSVTEMWAAPTKLQHQTTTATTKSGASSTTSRRTVSKVI